ncbi:hypothetical protein HPC49_04190 [Pyxidicoccus fallax]|uniref:Lipoprotein n=1 Tax=Pyxidicoccus fallax TaxID=394095 RepID=A0A848LCT2_9BACT|nr:hypothetical protein [Pyxidicoccus fallax]NMO16487.1 hypothetical protein [Pyxidicoccus fallax]NPC77451.1 hypothetical protein [Pyxidicoccus fallax]
MNLSLSRRGATALLLLAAVSLTTAGCAGRRKEAFLHDKAREHVYRKPIAEVWPQALALIKEKGFSLRGGKEGFEVQTEFKMAGAPSSLGTTWEAYLIRGIQKGPGQCSIEYWKRISTESRPADNTTGRTNEVNDSGPRTDTGNFNREEELEWELIQRIDTDSASALKAQAETIQ